LQRLEVSVIPSGKDQQEVTSSGLWLGRIWDLSLGLTGRAHTRTHALSEQAGCTWSPDLFSRTNNLRFP
jgi:hypothetical protein